ncbi:Rrf2 family transcriptional regulator [Candidatus Thiothrix anitrata]|uniref:Rrf2 family transcriptional regulator n=1 Tax=Candidatus Thiothrix anitrata TaxID=2823902 RepID=A0ABX7X1U1_9GAMM|nr:Rrf2 family transcriptional regulator [Candidatus Thiothrix anitrata]QTR49864.1 Rrf2 family transcriptional regulator [Candidatus Thiothrix anitrata]
MKLSTQGQHAIMAMLTLAIHDNTGAMRLGDIAIQQGISLSYLEQIFARLRNGGLVEGIRGPGGGYRLARPAEEISLAEIATVAEQEPEQDSATIPQREQVLRMWEDLSQQVYQFLEGITLDSLMEGHKIPRKAYKMSETASMIARMFPARLTVPGMGQYASL